MVSYVDFCNIPKLLFFTNFSNFLFGNFAITSVLLEFPQDISSLLVSLRKILEIDLEVSDPWSHMLLFVKSLFFYFSSFF